MGQTVLGAMVTGLALAGVLAIAGTAASLLGRRLPHLGAAAVGVGASAIAGRLALRPLPVVLGAVVVTAAVAGALAWLIEQRIAATATSDGWPPPLLAEVTLLALGVAVMALVRNPTAVELPLGVLGGLTSGPAAVSAMAVGLVATVALFLVRAKTRPPLVTWIAASVAIATTAALGSGMLALGSQPAVPAFGVPDVTGIALRAVAVAVIGRLGWVWLIVAALVLGVGEAVLRNGWTAGEFAIVPSLLIIAVAVRREQHQPVAA
jgi:hypothetical protein